MEYLDLYDKSRNSTGERVVRDKDKSNVPADRYIIIVLIFIQNNRGELLFQLTSKEKEHVIATTGGHVKSGQNSYEAILDEVSEELGLDISDDNVELVYSYLSRAAFIDVYYLKKDIDINKLILQKEEVESVNWLTIDEVNRLIEQGKIRKSNIKGFNAVVDYINNNI